MANNETCKPTEHKPICDDCIYFANGKGSEKCDSCELTGTNKARDMTKEEARAYLQKELDAAYERKEKVGMSEKTRYIKALEVAISVLDGKYDN